MGGGRTVIPVHDPKPTCKMAEKDPTNRVVPATKFPVVSSAIAIVMDKLGN
jgi:hypothetical protein